MSESTVPNCQNRLTSFDVNAREKQVIGAGPRIEAMPDADIPAQIRATVNATRASIGLGPANPLPEYTRLMAKNPSILRPHMEMGTAIFSGQIPPRERELAVLRVAWVSGAPFEWGEHVNIAKAFGVTRAEVERVTQGSSAAGWTEHEAAILRGVDELILDQTLYDHTYVTLARQWSEVQLIEYLMLIGHYVATAFVQNSLRARLADNNPGLRHR
jgi:4-carboxymuconolactone decarboxylase